MANALYDKGREKFLTGAINASADTLKCALIKDTYAPTLGSDEFFSTLSSHVVGTPQTLTSKTVTGGVLDAADVTFSAVPTAAVKYCAIYKDTGSAATSPLIALFDTAAGLPVSTNGGDIIIAWDNGANKIFKL
ncbi:hypothetical protein MC64_012280 [Aeromonas caviae]|jgi:hypothetical protein|uniref:hypothetical protein n=1 Tax=Gammaproteobacteria TaxID=1236 RepID=UPI0003D86265|nr:MULTISPECIES: hypothetical protein [Gammaproteobacteria]AHE50085.1 hypothetical protein AH4AK4_2644 [Aeromonas hydrophila 4AK4]KLV38642.1 hypothetical protein SH16_03412 [Aeromonas caviae]MBL0517672.1 hypothetical protein [Aeromonas caviae]MBL0654823.1 hypothetical protein [Aeromonas caviae]MBV7469166.1 hypothetical protein [Aeromonas sp. sif0611]